jgi:hypothetical protein
MAYDAKAVKISKAIKQLASTCATKAERKQLIRNYVRVLEMEIGNKANRTKGK